MTKREIEKILIANRGEIALRIIRAARLLEIETVATYSEQDRYSKHVQLADHSISLGSGPARDNYLNMDKIIEHALAEEVDAIHPGYGFLSERSVFAQKVIDAGLIWIGPPPEAIAKLGDKIASRLAAKKAGVPVTPGTDYPIEANEEAMKVAREIGYPIIIKAAHGGGGMGMMVVRDENDLMEAIKRTGNQAKAAFGRAEVFIERYVEKPRHIEIQFMADKHGNVVHLGERECSIQRRHQKLIEEAPSPIITQEQRDYIGGKVVQLAKDVGYENAGTAEFLYKDGEFFFNEVNARLQVEHPVTEMVTGKDLVLEQILVAMGRKLSWKQEDITFNGHAIELRINAENPVNEFAPSPGKIEALNFPGGFGVRFDSHIYQGYQVPSDYDSLLGKLIAWGSTRERAIYKAYYALSELTLTGFPNNLPLHRVILANKQFHKGNLHTDFIADNNILPYIKEAFNRRVAALLVSGIRTKKVILPDRPDSKWKNTGRFESVGRIA